MSKDAVQEIIMGIAVVALGYAMYTKFKGGGAAGYAGVAPGGQFAGVAANPVYGPSVGAPYNPATVSGSMGLAALLANTVGDIGSFNGQNYLDDMTETAIAGAGRDSVFVSGGYW